MKNRAIYIAEQALDVVKRRPFIIGVEVKNQVNGPKITVTFQSESGAASDVFAGFGESSESGLEIHGRLFDLADKLRIVSDGT